MSFAQLTPEMSARKILANIYSCTLPQFQNTYITYLSSFKYHLVVSAS